MPPCPSLHCVLLTSVAELEDLLPTWESLWQADKNATPFQHPGWLLPWWQQFGVPYAGRELRCVLVCAADRDSTGQGQASHALALVPFYLYPEPETGERQLLLLGAGTSDYLDGVFVAPDQETREAHASAALRFCFSRSDWDVLHAAQLRPGSPLRPAAERLGQLHASGGETNVAVTLWPAEPTSSVPATPLSDLPTKIRRNALYYRNRAERLGDLRLEQATTETCLAVFDQLVAMHTARWRAAGELGVLADPVVLAHHRAALPALARAGLLRLLSLRLGTDTLGVLYSLVDPARGPAPRTQYVYLPAFSLAHADLRPGTLLTALTLDQAAREGIRRVDFLRGEEAYKKLWHAEQTPTTGVTLRPLFCAEPRAP